MSRPGQFELQLGQLCNDRCVFCVSGYLTSQGKAPLLDVRELTDALDRAWAAGYRRVTLLGGEPTIQPCFLEVVRHATALGFELVVFSNGSKPGRSDLVDQVAKISPSVEWRFSFHGATREAHERTTRRKGSFDQLLRAIERVHARGHRITVNTCVVRQNFESLGRLPELLRPFEVAQLHVDMVNPYDTGLLHAGDGAPAVGPVASQPGDPRRIDAAEALAELQPRYSDLVRPLEQMVAGFPDAFDVNIGNLPYCVAPRLAPWIHHGGQPTWTLAANDRGEGKLGLKLRKYVVKGTYKSKTPRCRECAFDDRCSGVFDSYKAQFGVDELIPVTTRRLDELDDDGRLFALRAWLFVRAALEGVALPAGFVRLTVAEHGRREVAVVFATTANDAALTVLLRPPPGGAAATDRFALHAANVACAPALVEAALALLWRAALAAGARGVHPPGPDLVPRGLRPSVLGRLARLRRHAPYGELEWRRVDATPDGIEATFAEPGGASAVVWISETDGRPSGGYRVDGAGEGAPPVLVEGMRRVLVALGRLPASAHRP